MDDAETASSTGTRGPGDAVASMLRLLFVYGTLQPGEERWPLLAPYVVGEGQVVHVAGQLYDTGEGYPAAVFGQASGRRITGRLFEISDDSSGDALAHLDVVEATVEGLYRRVTVETTDGDRAWAYEYGDGLALVPIASGDWLRRD